MILNFSSVIKHYVKVLQSVYSQSKDKENIFQDFSVICSLQKNNVALSVINDSYLAIYYKNDIYYVLDQTLSSSTVKSFVRVLIEENRLHLLHSICNEFVNVCHHTKDIKEIIVYTAYPMNDVMKEAFADWFQSHLNYRFIINNHIDSSLIGGFVVQCGTYCFDMSIKHDVDKINCLMQKGNVL